MLSRSFVQGAMLAFWSAASFAQQTPAHSPHPALHEFPLTLQQSIESGKSKIGTKVLAKLASATMFQGKVIPRNAVFTGVVIESDAKSATDPAKIAIRMEMVEWKDGSTSVTAYLMPLYYAPTVQAIPSPPTESQDPSSRTLDGEQSQSPMQRPTPSSETAIPETSIISNHPVPIKNVTLARADEGGAAIVSEHGNIKLNKLTTYVFAAVERAPE